MTVPILLAGAAVFGVVTSMSKSKNLKSVKGGLMGSNDEVKEIIYNERVLELIQQKNQVEAEILDLVHE